MADNTLSETAVVQNVGLGAALLWRCGQGFQSEADQRPLPIPIAFLTFSVCLHQSTLEAILSTQRRSGLTLFAGKLGRNREDLLAVHPRALLYRPLTLDALAVGVSSKLLTVNYSLAAVRANTRPAPRDLPERVRRMLTGAERFGAWCGRLPLEQVATTLRVSF